MVFKDEIVNRSQKFADTCDLDEQLTQIARCLTGTSGKFGMILCGGVGNGKSTMMKAIQTLLNYMRIPYYNTVYGLRIKDAKSINEMNLHNYNTFLDVSRCPLLGIDDLGTEPLVIMDYGNEKTPIVDLLSMRYENRLFTIVTTNLTPKQIRERYGERIADRFNEMMEEQERLSHQSSLSMGNKGGDREIPSPPLFLESHWVRLHQHNNT